MCTVTIIYLYILVEATNSIIYVFSKKKYMN